MSDFRIENGVLVQYTGIGGDVVIPDSVTSIGYSAFYECDSLTSVTIPDSVTSIGAYAFYKCDSLTSVTIPDSVTSIGHSAFRECKKLTSVVIPDFVTSIGNEVFRECRSLTSVVIPDSVTSIGNEVFRECRSLTSVVIPDSVTSIGHRAFRGCKGLADKAGLVIVQSILYDYVGEATSVTIPDSVTSIEGKAFLNCKNLSSIVIPSSVTSIGDSAFSGCKHLTNVTIPDSVTSIGNWAFNGCIGLADKTGLVIVQSILYDYVGEATSVTIPDSVTSIGDSAFSGCKHLTSVTISDSVTSIGNWAFMDCTSLTSVTIPDSVTSIGVSAFLRCERLTSVTISDFVTSIGEYAFSDCTKLKDFACPQSFAKLLREFLPLIEKTVAIHIPDISDISAKFRPGAAVGFAEDHRSCSDANGQKYAKYIKSNAAKLSGLAIEHPALLYLMIHEKLITAKDLNAVMTAVQESGNTELIAAMLEYSNSGVSEKDKARVQQQQDQREANVTSFLFDAEKLEAIHGKCFAVAGKLKTFASRDELMECLKTCGAELMEDIASGVHYLITNTPDSGTAKNKKAIELGIQRISEDQFNEMIGRKVQK